MVGAARRLMRQVGGRLAAAAMAVLAASCTPAALSAPPRASAREGVPVMAPAPAAPPRYQALLVAADGSIAVFDNATRRLERDLTGTSAAHVVRLSARSRRRPATVASTLRAIAAMRPAPGQACLIYVTSHGARDAGLVFSRDDDVLDPGRLAAAVEHGCGSAPTVVVLSGCYSGLYAAPPLAGPDRIIITAARRDRPSFGCGAGEVYTVFDRCMITAIERGGTWQGAFDAAHGCVAAEEQREDERPSQPQARFGTAVAALPRPAARAAPRPPPLAAARP